MAKEDNAQGIDDLLDDIPEGDEQVTDEVQTEQPAAEETTTEETEETVETTEETESQVAKLFDKQEVDHSGKTVPLEKHTELRKRAQAAEAEAAALKAQQVNADTDVLAELSGLVEGDDDEYIDKQKLKEVIGKLPDLITHVAQTSVRETLNRAATQNVQAKASTDEVAFRKDHADYDKVTNFVMSRNLLTNEERQKVFSSPNIAEAYYNLGVQKIKQEQEILGVAQTSQPSNSNNNNQPTGGDPIDDGSEFENDDEAFNAMIDPSS